MHVRMVGMLAAVLLIACGSDENNGSGGNNGGKSTTRDCSLDLPLSGAVEETLSWGASEGCAGATSGGLVTLTFGAFNDGSVVIGLSGAVAGMTGPVSAYVRYRTSDGDEWTAQGCTLDLTRNEVIDSDEDFGDTYVLAATGSCANPATVTDGDADADLVFGDFEFVHDMVPGWGD